MSEEGLFFMLQSRYWQRDWLPLKNQSIKLTWLVAELSEVQHIMRGFIANSSHSAFRAQNIAELAMSAEGLFFLLVHAL